jgi:hypothetical protein
MPGEQPSVNGAAGRATRALSSLRLQPPLEAAKASVDDYKIMAPKCGTP